MKIGKKNNLQSSIERSSYHNSFISKFAVQFGYKLVFVTNVAKSIECGVPRSVHSTVTRTFSGSVPVPPGYVTYHCPLGKLSTAIGELPGKVPGISSKAVSRINSIFDLATFVAVTICPDMAVYLYPAIKRLIVDVDANTIKTVAMSASIIVNPFSFDLINLFTFITPLKMKNEE